MKRFLFLFTLIATMSGLTAQETGAAAASSAEATQSSNWQNWVFASSALLTATAGVVIISLNTGNTSH